MTTAYLPFELQKAVYEVLKASSALGLKLGATGQDDKIYDAVRDGQAYPYLTLGEAEHQDRGSDDTDGWDTEFTIHVWARGPKLGRQFILEVQKLIHDLLHNVDLNLGDELTTLSLRRSFATVVREPDNATYHGIQRFSILTGEI